MVVMVGKWQNFNGENSGEFGTLQLGCFGSDKHLQKFILTLLKPL